METLTHFTIPVIFKLCFPMDQIIKLFSRNFRSNWCWLIRFRFRRKSSTLNCLKEYFWFNFKQLNFNATFGRATLGDTAMLAGWHVNVSWLTSDLPPIHHPLFHPLKRLTDYVRTIQPHSTALYPFFPSFCFCLGLPFSSFSFLLSPIETVYYTSLDLTYPYLRKCDMQSSKIA